MPEPVSEDSLQRPLIQRTIPQMSGDEHLERLRSDIDTVLQLQLQSWSDDAWEPVAEALAEYGFGVMKAWMHTGQIYPEVARTGYGALPSCPREWLDDDTVEELAGEAVSKALKYFKFEVLMKNQWNATRGASLATYFVGQCKRQFSNVYVVWHRDRSDHHGLFSHDEKPEVLPSLPDSPSSQVLRSASIQALLDRLSSPLAREVFLKKFVEGHSYEAIAESTPGIKDAKAAENLVYREKKRLIQ